MLSLLSAVFRPFPKPVSVHSASPDEIIAAAIVESFAKNYDDWKYLVNDESSFYSYSPPDWPKEMLKNPPFIHVKVNRYLFNESKDISILYRAYRTRDNFYVNGTKLETYAGLAMVNSFERLKNEHDKANALARQIKENQDRTQAAWNLAERLLGKKRISTGALVPATSFCETCVRHDGEPVETHNGVVYLCSGCRKKDKCIPSTGSSGSAVTTAVKSTAPVAALSAPQKTTVSTGFLTLLTKPPGSIVRVDGFENSSPLLTPL